MIPLMLCFGTRRRDRRTRAGILLLVVMGHAVMLGVAILPRARAPAVPAAPALTLFLPPPPPARPPAPIPVRAVAVVTAAAARAGRRADPVPIIAPPPIVILPPPSLIVAPAAGDGTAPSAGSAADGRDGGAGGEGDGRGAGRGGPGTGGGIASRARRLAGAIDPRDYPSPARRRGAQGASTVAFLVDDAGHPRDCTVTRTSGDADLDGATCRLILARFRYAPARDAAGRPVPERRGWRQDWWFD